MAYETGTALCYKHLLLRLKLFLEDNNWVVNRWQGNGTGIVTAIKVVPIAAGAGYSENEILTIVGGNGDATVKVVSVDGTGAVTELVLVNGGTGYTSDSGVATTYEGAGAGCTVEFVTNGEYELLLKGTGLAGADEIYVGIQTNSSIAGDYYNWNIVGALGYSSGQAFNYQPGAYAVTGAPSLLLANFPMTYHLVATGRRFILVVNISTVWVSMHAGFLIPYMPPSRLPYPAMLCGSNVSTTLRWSTTTTHNNAIVYSASTGAVRMYDGEWRQLSNNSSNFGTWPRSYYSYASAHSITKNTDDTYTLFPLILHMKSPIGRVWGEIEGAYFLCGVGQAAGNEIEVNGDTYLVIQDVWRTGLNDYWALKLE